MRGRLADTDIEVVHIVGGGVHHELLCQLTADACGLPVIAGPAEAAALGNVAAQARAHGVIGDDAGLVRRQLYDTLPLRRYEPSDEHGGRQAWARAAATVRAGS